MEERRVEVPGGRLGVLTPDVAHLIATEAPIEMAALIAEILAPQARWD